MPVPIRAILARKQAWVRECVLIGRSFVRNLPGIAVFPDIVGGRI
jgi:hypothetical protein